MSREEADRLAASMTAWEFQMFCEGYNLAAAVRDSIDTEKQDAARTPGEGRGG